MKRVLFAVVFLSAIIIGCIVAIRTESKQLREMIAMTYQMEENLKNGNTHEALRLARQLEQEFPQRTKTFHLFLHHNVLNEIEENIATLSAYLEGNDTHEFLAQVNRCRLLLQKQLEAELPTWRNIF